MLQRKNQCKRTTGGVRRLFNVCLTAAVAVMFVMILRYDGVQAPVLEKKVIFLGPGCGHVAYTMGFVGGLLEDPELRKAILRHAVFGGVSSGALTASYAMAALHGVHDMRHWYVTEMRRGFEMVEKGGTLVMGAEIEKAGLRYHETIVEAFGEEPVPWLDAFVMSFTTLPSLRPHFVSNLSTATPAQFAHATVASSYVPGVMGVKPWLRLGFGDRGDVPLFDGFLGTLRTIFPAGYLYVAFLPTIPSWLLSCADQLNAYEYDTSPGWLLSKAWPWGDPIWADQGFENGFADATANLLALRRQILAFLEDEQ